MEFQGITIDTKCPGLGQLVLPIAAAQQTNRQHPRPPRGQEIPHRIADYEAIVDRNAQALLTREEKIWRRLRALDVPALHDDCLGADAKAVERRVNLRTTA